MDKAQLSTNLINAIIGYLVKQPFEEVAGLISAIQDEAKQNGEQIVPGPSK